MQNQQHNKVQWLTIEAEYEGQRIDNYLLRILKGVPKSMIYRILRRGEVRVNKGRVKPTYRLKAADELRIPPIRMSIGVDKGSKKTGQALDARILYEDKRLLIINKPSGLAVHGGSGIQFGVIESMRKSRPDLHYLELAHRLDRDTSGCLVLAKKRSALRQLHELLRTGKVQKRYLALVQGNWQYGTKNIDVPLQKQVLRSGERVVRASEQGKPASSTFRPLAVSKKASLLEVEIHTGRTHQIRVHAAHSGHPVAGDDKYGDEGFNRYLASMGFKRLFLHARGIAFELEEPHVDIAVNAPLDRDFEDLLSKLNLAI
ncbi:MAG: 23S rRNA pseudouridine(955/2504/2580) synthase RluC [Thioalkalispiraceae bacterium]|jgi:23S rRNA pseudouridine955/2504/2580 synthase